MMTACGTWPPGLPFNVAARVTGVQPAALEESLVTLNCEGPVYSKIVFTVTLPRLPSKKSYRMPCGAVASCSDQHSAQQLYSAGLLWPGEEADLFALTVPT